MAMPKFINLYNQCLVNDNIKLTKIEYLHEINKIMNFKLNDDVIEELMIVTNNNMYNFVHFSMLFKYGIIKENEKKNIKKYLSLYDPSQYYKKNNEYYISAELFEMILCRSSYVLNSIFHMFMTYNHWYSDYQYRYSKINNI
jgi:hypothetical protein